MLISCWDEAKEPEFIGEGVVDLTEVLTKGETDGVCVHSYSGQTQLTFFRMVYHNK